jgi:membrane peptidoglycan carboxypeptidase
MTGAGMTSYGSWDSASTAPLPGGPYLGDPGQYPIVPGWPDPAGTLGGTRRVRRRRRWFARSLATLLGLFLLAALALVGLVMVTPSVSDAPARARALDVSHHAVYPGPAVPYRFSASLISTEDHRFYHEPGIDPLALGRLVVGRFTGQPDQGGATLYLQLAKMLYTSGRSGLMVSAEQVGLGIKLYATYPKAQILQMYADVAYFGHGYYGLPAASCGYFGVAPSRLTWTQSAMLAGVVQAPTADDPIAHLTAARAREAHVLGRLVATGKLTQAQAADAFRQPLGLVGGSPTGCATS